MKTELFKGEAPNHKITLLKDHAIKIEETTHSKPLTQREIESHQTSHAQLSIKLMQLEEQKKEFIAAYKFDKKPLVEQAKESLKLVRTGVSEVTEDLYLIEDQETGEMGYYDEMGMLIKTRPLLAFERQLRITPNQAIGE